MGKGLLRSFSICGLLPGTLFFAASLTPTLLPRNVFAQGALAGSCLAAGYGIGVFGHWLWVYMKFLALEGRALRVARLVGAAGCLVASVLALSQAARWQNSIRALMQLEPVDAAYPLMAAPIALAGFAILVALARLFRLTLRFVAASVGRF